MHCVGAQFSQIKFRIMLFFITVTVLVASVNADFYKDCGSQATVNKVTVAGCSQRDNECALRRDTDAEFSIEFTPHQQVTLLFTVIHGILMELPVPFPLGQPDACIDSGLTCPLRADVPATFSKTIPILKSYPQTKVGVKWELQDENHENIVCIIIQAKVN